MRSCKNGEKLTANRIGNIHFGKWFLYATAEKDDVWRKPVIDEKGIILFDNYIQIMRINVNVKLNIFVYHVLFAGKASFLRNYFKAVQPTYESHISNLEFLNIQAAKDCVDQYIERLNNLIIFI